MMELHSVQTVVQDAADSCNKRNYIVKVKMVMRG